MKAELNDWNLLNRDALCLRRTPSLSGDRFSLSVRRSNKQTIWRDIMIVATIRSAFATRTPKKCFQ
jgi:hypothetical protein